MTDFKRAVKLIEENDLNSLKQLIEKDRSILDDRKEFGNSLLHIAIRKRKLAAIELLLDLGADLDSRDLLDWTPLHTTVKEGDPEIVKLLLDRGAEVNCKNYDYWPVLHLAIYEKSIDIARLLILYGADPYLKDREGRTALDYLESVRIKNELQFIYHNRERILREKSRIKDR